jgi:hypothetical protein
LGSMRAASDIEAVSAGLAAATNVDDTAAAAGGAPLWCAGEELSEVRAEDGSEAEGVSDGWKVAMAAGRGCGGGSSTAAAESEAASALHDDENVTVEADGLGTVGEEEDDAGIEEGREDDKEEGGEAAGAGAAGNELLAGPSIA